MIVPLLALGCLCLDRDLPVAAGAIFAVATTFLLIPASWPTSYNALLLVPGCILIVGTVEVPRLARNCTLIVIALEYALPLIAPTLYVSPRFRFLVAPLVTLTGGNFLLPMAVAAALAAYCFVVSPWKPQGSQPPHEPRETWVVA